MCASTWAKDKYCNVSATNVELTSKFHLTFLFIAIREILSRCWNPLDQDSLVYSVCVCVCVLHKDRDIIERQHGVCQPEGRYYTVIPARLQTAFKRKRLFAFSCWACWLIHFACIQYIFLGFHNFLKLQKFPGISSIFLAWFLGIS